MVFIATNRLIVKGKVAFMTKTKKALIAGSFDPITIGHMDIIRRTAAVFDKVFVVITENSEKVYMFDKQSRLDMAKHACEDLSNVEVLIHEGLVAELAKSKSAVIIKGVRNSVDFAYEYSLSSINKEISGVDTFLIPANPEFAHISSSFVREMLKYGKNAEKYIGNGVD